MLKTETATDDSVADTVDATVNATANTTQTNTESESERDTERPQRYRDQVRAADLRATERDDERPAYFETARELPAPNEAPDGPPDGVVWFRRKPRACRVKPTQPATRKGTKKRKKKYQEIVVKADFEVEDIIDERWVSSKPPRRQFMVTWAGYSAEHDTWVDESDVNLVRGRKKLIDCWEDEKTKQSKRVEEHNIRTLNDKTWTMVCTVSYCIVPYDMVIRVSYYICQCPLFWQAYFVREACAKTHVHYRHGKGQKNIGRMTEVTLPDGTKVRQAKQAMKNGNTGAFKHTKIRSIEKVPCGEATWNLFLKSRCLKESSNDIHLAIGSQETQKISFCVLEDCREFMYE